MNFDDLRAPLFLEERRAHLRPGATGVYVLGGNGNDEAGDTHGLATFFHATTLSNLRASLRRVPR